MTIDYIAPQCYFKSGASQELGEILAAQKYQKVLCISDKGVKDAGIMDRIVGKMNEAGLEVVEYSEVCSDPTVHVVDAAGKLARDCKADCIVAIGGGSSLDTAKVASLLATNTGSAKDYFGKGTVPNKCIPIFAVPTTAGTGSEITTCAIVSDVESGKKMFIMDSKLLASMAILDPELLVKLPASITASTGMDALSHAMESYTSIANNPIVEANSLKAIELITKSLRRCIDDGEDIESRGDMLLASAMAGMSFGNSAVHIGHAFAHAMGATWHIPHGVACAIALPIAIKHCGASMPERIEKIAEAMGMKLSKDSSPEENTKAVCDAIEELSKTVGIPTLREMGISPKGIDEIVQATMEETSHQLSGVPFDEVHCRIAYETLLEK